MSDNPRIWLLFGLVGWIFSAAGAGLVALAAGPMGVVLPLETVAGALSLVGLQACIASVLGLEKPVARMVAVGGVVVGGLVLGAVVVRGPLAARRSTMRVHSEDAHLAATLYSARLSKKVGVVFVHGSGCETQKEYRYYARMLGRQGISSIVYDKRGCGESTGHLYDGTYRDYAADAAAAARLLKERASLEHIGFVGFSEAEWVVPLAMKETDADFAVIIGAGGLSPADQVIEESRIREEAGLPPEASADMSPDEKAWWTQVADFDPNAAWEGVTGKVLFIKGADDDRSRASASRLRLATMLPSGQCEWLEYEGAGHMILLWPRGKGQPPPHFPKGYPTVIGRWIRKTIGKNVKTTGDIVGCQSTAHVRKD